MRSSWALKLLKRPALVRYQCIYSSSCLLQTERLSTVPNFGLRNFSNNDDNKSSLTQLRELRKLSGAPIVDCKKALSETEGDTKKAIDWLRQHGTAKASKKLSDREAENGLIAIKVSEDGKSASMVKVSCETDFAGKTDTFVNLACHVASDTLNNDSTIDNGSGLSESVQTALDEAIVAIRENLNVRTAVQLTTTQDDGLLVAYVHGKVDSRYNAGLAAAIVEISGTGELENAGKKLAMHIVAAKPTFLDPSLIPEDIIEREKKILKNQIADSNKPPEIVERIINGRMQKFYAEVCLTEQEHMVEEGKVKVSKALEDQGLTVKSFRLLMI